MATKKSVGTMQQYRNKEGLLELEKTKGLKKTWKSYTFKVSASTYLLCFKSDMSNPERTLLLAEVTKVLPAACHGASFPFEVHFRGKGSPWKLNAGSNEERIGWMEAILPGSSSSVTRFQQMREGIPSPTMADTSQPPSSLPPPYTSSTNTTPSRKHGHHSASIGSDPRYRADPNPYIEVPKTTPISSNALASDGEDDTFLTASLGAPTTPVSHTPQNYLVPSDSPTPPDKGTKIHQPPRHSSSDGEFIKPSPRPRPRPRTPRASPAPEPRPPKPKSDDDDYIKMMSSPARRLETTMSEGELPQYLEVVGADHDPTLDEDNYVIPNSPPKQTRSSNSLRKPVGGVNSTQGAESGGGGGNLADTISQHFNKEQIGMLIQMLQEVRVDKRQTAEEEAKAWEVRSPASPSSPTPYSGEDSITLRGHLTRALSYAPNFSEGILVTEEDSDESYEQRPHWAKAVPANGRASPNPEQQLDTLSNLQQEALYISKSHISELKVIGRGQFGEVFKGMLVRGAESMPVAVKMTKRTISDYLQESFMKEMTIMSQMMHPNIVRLYGIVNEDVPSPWIVLEYMEHGDLKTFLTKNKRSASQLVKYMVDVAMGMHYISERGLVHRDLAARNVLVGANEICKVADFGLLREIPRDLSEYTSSHSIPCPIRWMPPESISDRRFSAASDVWSFGVLVWEMFNPTKLPFDKYDNMAVVSKVNEGLRLPIPRGIPSIVAKIMKACWHRNPSKRPSFLLISTLLSTRTTF